MHGTTDQRGEIPTDTETMFAASNDAAAHVNDGTCGTFGDLLMMPLVEPLASSLATAKSLFLRMPLAMRTTAFDQRKKLFATLT